MVFRARGAQRLVTSQMRAAHEIFPPGEVGRRRRVLAWLAAAPLAARAQGPASGAAPAPDPDGTLRRVQLLADARQRLAVRVDRPLPAAALRLRLAFEQPLPEAPEAQHEYAAPIDFGERVVQEIHLLLSLPPPVAARSVVLQGDLASAQVVAGDSREATRVLWSAEDFRARQAGTVRWRRR